MTKSISAILQESLYSEENFSEEAEYESAMADLQVDVNHSSLCVKKFQIVCVVVLKTRLYCIMSNKSHIHFYVNEVFAYTRTINNFFQQLSTKQF